MEAQQLAEASAALSVDVKTQDQVEPEPQLSNSPTEDKQSKKKKKKKKKNRRKSIERTESEVTEVTLDPEQEQEEAVIQDKEEEDTLKALLQDNKEEETSIQGNQEEEAAAIQPEEASTEETAPTKPEEEQHEAAAANGDALGPPSLERQSSLDNLKATGTRAVGSLFSRFKVGRKKPLPTRTESAAKLELVNPSPVKTAVKKLEVPEEKTLDDLPMRTKRDFFGEGEQSIHVSAEKLKYDELDKQRRVEKEAEEAAKAARQTPPSSSRSNGDVLAQIEADKDALETGSGLEIESTAETVLNESTVDEPTAEISTEAVTPTTAETVIEESIKPDDVVSTPETVDDPKSTEAAVEHPSDQETASLKTTEAAADPQVTTTKVEDNSTASPTSEVVSEEQTEAEQPTADSSKIEPISLELDLDPDLNNNAVETVVEEVTSETDQHVTEPAEAALSSNTESQNEDTLLLPVKVTPPTTELPAEAAEPAKPEKMSPVKSLASRFEGKREQSLDSLKFRTVREFFPEERSIRVGAEKQKYEAQAQQQKLKSKAEDEAKSKYKAGAGFKSPDKEAVMIPASPELTARASTAAVAPPVIAPLSGVADAVESSTPDKAVGRKTFSFDEAYANSPSKFGDDAPEGLTPVKSIASRFEGKREQSLDSLKFRTVREFFPEERSVRVGSEKQKFEAQAQQGNSLDKLKFRTVREFFPEEGKRSIHVGAEKAKYEALTKHQEEEAKAAEQLKLKHAAPSPTIVDMKQSSEVASLLEATTPVDGSTVEPPASVPELKEVIAAESRETSASTETAVDEAVTEVNESLSTAATSVVTEKESGLVVAPAECETTKDAPVEENQLDGEEDVLATEPNAVFTNVGVVSSEEVNDRDIKKNGEIAGVAEEVAEHDKQVEHKPREPAEEIDLKGEHDVVPVVMLEDEQQSAQETELEPQDDLEEATRETEETLDLQKVDVIKSIVEAQVKTAAEISSESVEEANSNLVQGQQNQDSVEQCDETAEEDAGDGLVELDLNEPVEEEQDESVAVIAADIKLEEDQEVVNEAQTEVVASSSGGENGLVELELGEPVVEKPSVDSSKHADVKSRPMLTTERSFVMENDTTIKTEDTVVVAERPMTDDEVEPLSASKMQPDHELSSRTESSKAKKESSSSRKPSTKSSHSSKTSPKLTRKISVGSAGSLKSPPASTTVPVPMKRASITAPTASYMAKKAAEAEELHRKASPQLKKRRSASNVKGTVSETGFIKPPPAAPTVPVPMKRASITAPTASWQARNIPDQADKATESHHIPKAHTSKPKGTVGPTGFVKPLPPPPTVPVAPKRASIMAPTASYMAKKAAERAEVVDVAAPTPLARNTRYSNVKSKVLEGIQSGFQETVVHKTITKEEYIAAERRKSLGAAGVRSVLDAVDRRASLTARATIDGPPEPFIRSAESRKKLNSTVPRYMNYESSSGYAERARQQYERRKRLEEENAAKSEKRQKELRMFFAEQQQKAMNFRAEEVRRGLESHEFTKLAKESEMDAQKALRKEKQRARSSRTPHRASSATSASSSNGVASRASKKSSVSSVEAKVAVESTTEEPAVKTEAAIESVVVGEPLAEAPSTAEKEPSAEVEQAIVETTQVEEQPVHVPIVDEDPALEHVAKKIDFDEASSDSDEKDVADV